MKKILAIFVLLTLMACTPADDGQLEDIPADGQGTIYF
jgi:hypothetical protein